MQAREKEWLEHYVWSLMKQQVQREQQASGLQQELVWMEQQYSMRRRRVLARAAVSKRVQAE